MKSLLLLAVALALTSSPASAEEKNGLSVVVAKVTLEKNDRRSSYSYSQTNRVQALKATVKNISFKPMPEGELVWQIVVVGAYSNTLYAGLEKVNALKPAETQELVLGSAETSAWRGDSSRGGDKIEYQITVKQGGKEVIKFQTTQNFDVLAKRASKASSS